MTIGHSNCQSQSVAWYASCISGFLLFLQWVTVLQTNNLLPSACLMFLCIWLFVYFFRLFLVCVTFLLSLLFGPVCTGVYWLKSGYFIPRLIKSWLFTLCACTFRKNSALDARQSGWRMCVFIFPSVSVAGILMGVMRRNFTPFYGRYYAFPFLLIWH